MDNSEYCYIHSIGKFKGVNWQKSGTTHIGIILTLIIFLYTCHTGATIKNQESIIGNQNEQLGLLRKMERIDRLSYDSLIAKYSEGYILFASDHVTFITPIKSHLSSYYEFRWEKAQILDISASGIKIQLPDINFKPYNISASGVVVTLKRYVPPATYSYPLDIFPDNKAYIEILSDDADGIIYVLGFIKKENQPPLK